MGPPRACPMSIASVLGAAESRFKGRFGQVIISHTECGADLVCDTGDDEATWSQYPESWHPPSTGFLLGYFFPSKTNLDHDKSSLASILLHL